MDVTLADACDLCLVLPGRYTCPRCNVRFCSLPCYRGVRHHSCSEAFYRRSVLEELRRRCPSTDGTMRDILLRYWQSRAAPGTEECETRPEEEERGPSSEHKDQREGLEEEEEERHLWARLTPQEKEEFQRLVKSGGIGALVPQWKPWWERHETAKLVQEERSLVPPGRQRENGARRAAPQERGDGEEQRKRETEADPQERARGMPQKRGEGKNQPAPQTGAIETYKHTSGDTEMAGSPLLGEEAMPAILDNIPPLRTLTHTPSPLVPYSVVNILYAYTFSLKLYNGDLSEAFILQEFCETVLAVSGVLNSKRVFHSTAEAMQAGMQAAQSGKFTNDPQGPSEAMKSVIHILRGENKASQKNYTLAALSHLIGLLRNAKKLMQKEVKKKVFEAQKKCEFLLAWANEHEDTLTLLSVEAQTEYRIHRDQLKEIEVISEQLEKVWGGKKPSEKKVLIQELN